MAIQNIGYKKYGFDTILMIIFALLIVDVIVDKSLKYFYGASSFYIRLASNVGIAMGAIIVYYLIILKNPKKQT